MLAQLFFWAGSEVTGQSMEGGMYSSQPRELWPGLGVGALLGLCDGVGPTPSLVTNPDCHLSGSGEQILIPPGVRSEGPSNSEV